MLTLGTGEEKVIRIGVSGGDAAAERTYRIYLEELPKPADPAEGANVRMVTKAGVPVFIAPVKAVTTGSIQDLAAAGGAVRFLVRNEGNVHVLVKSITVSGMDKAGAQLFDSDLKAWYLLRGASRQYSTPIPRETCAGLARVDVEVVTDRYTLKGSAPVDVRTCPP